MSVLLDIRDLSVRYPRSAAPALSGLSLSLHAQERLAVIGESGSGKSTLARAIAGLLPAGAAQGGTLDWQGDQMRLGRDIGYVFQDPGGSLNPLLSIGAHLDEVIKTHQGGTRAQRQARALALLEQVQLPQPALALHAFPHQFSGGQRQRIAIALAIAAAPRLLIADEATSALDVLVQAEIVALLRRLCAQNQMALLFITHDIALAGSLGQRIAVLHQTRLVEIGTAEQVIHHPSQMYTRSLLAATIDLNSPRRVSV
ncbi:ABC transporter ATP-binding protein [Ketogulonicigenium vulgare]|uniref:ABC transporter ATP-binding protein n=1 Tax=Ketogulonicigenium vulgare TaxID=92945 RepID=UPI00235A0494|nr:ABC transporter ATP-binding protein [Ketogulonicigenium vulgare]